MPAVRFAAVIFALLAFAPAANAALPAPTELRPFLLRADEAPARTFPRTPSFAWKPVRAVTRSRVTKWSAPFGFNMRWTNLPQAQVSAPGLIRWDTVAGATGYQVWFLSPRKRIATKTNVADEREHWTFHQHPYWTAAVPWRVR